ncbi:uncharacterized protein [Watersipora subatra]|uniref:uncharacterized protein n=1 Tax=Watersipora subatra TaxID=2589382 RepID=UPI00355C1A9F
MANFLSASYLQRHGTLSLEELKHVVVAEHGVHLSTSQLSKLSLRKGICRRGYNLTADIETILEKLLELINSSSGLIGYRTVWQILNNEYGLNVRQRDVMLLMKIVDFEGVQMRKCRTLKRRVYHAPGPNYVWHIDGWDKLKKFGFAVHGCIDGFSRYVLWLEVGVTNNDPAVIAKYFLDQVEKIKALPKIVRADRGTENVNVERIQSELRTVHSDSMSGKAFLYGKSTRNQRIERFWRSLREGCLQPFIHLFDDLESKGQISTANETHIEAIRFSFMDIIREQLKIFKERWNTHRIRPKKDGDAYGVPKVLYLTDCH